MSTLSISPELVGIAEAHNLIPFAHYTETEAATALKLPLATLRRLRRDRRIGCVRKSPRRYAFFGYQLAEYLLLAIEDALCPAMPAATIRSETSGYPNRREVQPGVELGTTLSLDKRDALASARRILS